MMKICSACLLGIKCRYDGRDNSDKASDDLLKKYENGELIPVCPEQLGGLSTPRSGARIQNGDGYYVLDGESKVVTDDGQDVTDQYINGAQITLKIAQDLDIKEAILKQGSPSCGSCYTQGGFDSRSSIEGNGVTAALLKRNGITVISEQDL